MSRRAFLQSLACVACASWTGPALASEELIVIVNPGLGPKSLSAADLEAIFTARQEFWPNGDRITAINFPAKHPLRVEFDRVVLHMDPDTVARYWIDRRVRGGNRPPRTVADAGTIVKVVEHLKSAISYVPAALGSAGVSVVARVSGGKLIPGK